MQTAFGIDPSLTGTGLCVICDSGEVASFTITSAPADSLVSRFLRYGGLIEDVVDKLPLPQPTVICIEGYSFMSKGVAAQSLVEYGALLRHRMLGLTTVYEVPPSSLKLFASGKGNADKTAVALAVWKRWEREFHNDNETDAFVLARMAACIAGFDEPQNAEQRRAIESVVNGKKKAKAKA